VEGLHCGWAIVNDKHKEASPLVGTAANCEGDRRRQIHDIVLYATVQKSSDLTKSAPREAYERSSEHASPSTVNQGTLWRCIVAVVVRLLCLLI